MQIRLVLFGLSCLLSAACNVTAAEKNMPPREYLEWLENLKAEMLEKGISQPTIDAAFAKNYYHPKSPIIKTDRNQTEFILTSGQYLKRVVSPYRQKLARDKYKALYPQYKNIGKQGVPLNYLIAFWGIETNFGQTFGGYNAIEALTVLSYDTRRPAFFKNELYYALKILDEGNISPDKMESSWAGALGHFQFMPTTYDAYAVDENKNGKKDIWNEFGDALASASNYLNSMGWKAGEPWGKPVELSWNFDYSQTGRNHKKSVKEWKKSGVKVSGVDERLQGSVIVPEGRRGQAFLVFDNFHIIMKWNRSENYALAVGLLADSIVSKQPVREFSESGGYVLSNKDILLIQEFIAQRKIADIHADGRFGSQTRQAVQKLQQKFHIPADGWPDYRLLENIRRYDSVWGYAFPLPPQRLHSKK